MRGRLLILMGAIILLAVVLVVVLMTGNKKKDETTATPTEEAGVEETTVPGVQTDGGGETPGQPVYEDMVQIVVSYQDLARGMVIPEDNKDQNGQKIVDLLPWPRWALGCPPEEIESCYYTKIEDVQGKIVRTDIYRNSPILRKYIVENLYDIARTGSDAAAVLAGLPDPPLNEYYRYPQTYWVAVSVPLDFSGIGQVAYGIQDGDYVDVILSFLFVDVDPTFQTRLPNNIAVLTRLETGELSIGAPRQGRTEPSTLSPEGIMVSPSEQSQRPRLMTQRTVTNAFVVHVGDFPQGGHYLGATPTPMQIAAPPAPPGEGSSQSVPTAMPTATSWAPIIITLGVTPQDALVLAWAIDLEIPITFALREAGNSSVTRTDPVTLEYMLNSFTKDDAGNPQVPKTLPYSLEPAITSVRRFDLSTLYHFMGSAVGAAAEEQNQ